MRTKEFGEGGVTLFLRAWVKREDYWTAYYDTVEAVHAGFERAGLPTPERRINIKLLETENDKDGRKGKN